MHQMQLPEMTWTWPTASSNRDLKGLAYFVSFKVKISWRVLEESFYEICA